jgi:PAS domain S-box-containing protein
MFLSRLSSNSLRIVGALVLLTALAMCIVGVFKYFEERAAVVGAIEELQLLDHNMINIASAETGQRGFLLTGDLSYLAPYNAAQANIEATQSALATAFVRSGLVRKASLDHLRALSAAKLAELKRTIALRRGGDETAALAIVRTNEGQRLMNAIRANSQALVDVTLTRIILARRTTLVYLSMSGASGIVLACGLGLLIGAGYTRRRQTRSSLQRLTNAFQLTQGMIRTLEGRITVWSDGAARLYRIGAAEAIGKMSHDLLRTSFPESLSSINAALLSKGRWEGQLVHQRRDGVRLIVASQWMLSYEDGGQPPLVIEIDNDITEISDAREVLALRERARGQLAAIVESSNDAIISKDLSGIITFWNEAAEEMFGYAAAEAIGQPISIIIPAAAKATRTLSLSSLPSQIRRRVMDGSTRRPRSGRHDAVPRLQAWYRRSSRLSGATRKSRLSRNRYQPFTSLQSHVLAQRVLSSPLRQLIRLMKSRTPL